MRFHRVLLVVNPASATVLQLDAQGGRPALLRFNDDGPMTAPPRKPKTERKRRG